METEKKTNKGLCCLVLTSTFLNISSTILLDPQGPFGFHVKGVSLNLLRLFNILRQTKSLCFGYPCSKQQKCVWEVSRTNLNSSDQPTGVVLDIISWAKPLYHWDLKHFPPLKLAAKWFLPPGTVRNSLLISSFKNGTSWEEKILSGSQVFC